MSTPIDRLKANYASAEEHLNAIVKAVVGQFKIPEAQHAQVKKAVRAAFDVGRRTTTTDDWCNFF